MSYSLFTMAKMQINCRLKKTLEILDYQSPGAKNRILNTWHLNTSLNLYGGGERDRTDDLMLAKHVLSQLSYTPVDKN